MNAPRCIRLELLRGNRVAESPTPRISLPPLPLTTSRQHLPSGVIALLENIPIFAGLANDALQLLLEHTKGQDFPEAELIVREGDKSSSMFVIASGQVRVCKNFGTANEVELATLGPKDFFGEMCIVDTLPRCATIQARTQSTVFSISSMAFYRLYKTLPSQHSILVLNIARDLSRRLRNVDALFAARH